MTHKEYQKKLSRKIEKWQKRKSRPLREEWLSAALMLQRLDLEQVRQDLEKLYSPSPRGRPHFDPVSMLRALLLMTLLQFISIPQFVTELRRKPRLAAIAGFEPESIAAVGT